MGASRSDEEDSNGEVTSWTQRGSRLPAAGTPTSWTPCPRCRRSSSGVLSSISCLFYCGSETSPGVRLRLQEMPAWSACHRQRLHSRLERSRGNAMLLAGSVSSTMQSTPVARAYRPGSCSHPGASNAGVRLKPQDAK